MSIKSSQIFANSAGESKPFVAIEVRLVQSCECHFTKDAHVPARIEAGYQLNIPPELSDCDVVAVAAGLTAYTKLAVNELVARLVNGGMFTEAAREEIIANANRVYASLKKGGAA